MLRDAPPLPLATSYLWDAFLDLKGPFIEGAIPYTEMAAWCSLRGITLEVWEVRAIKEVDQAFRKQQAEDVKRWTSQH